MTDTSPSYTSGASPDCPRCGVGMVRRTARRGPNQGNQFWGCPKYPKCRGVIYGSASAEPKGPPLSKAKTEDEAPAASVAEQLERAGRPAVAHRGKIRSAVVKVARVVDNIERWQLERDEPDAAGRWDPDHARKVLRYVYDRDGGRCGICGAEMKIKGAHIEHIVPKVFAWFDLRRSGKVATGTQYRSLLHKLDRLQP